MTVTLRDKVRVVECGIELETVMDAISDMVAVGDGVGGGVMVGVTEADAEAVLSRVADSALMVVDADGNDEKERDIELVFVAEKEALGAIDAERVEVAVLLSGDAVRTLESVDDSLPDAVVDGDAELDRLFDTVGSRENVFESVSSRENVARDQVPVSDMVGDTVNV